MGDSSSFDSGLLWTAIAGTAAGLTIAVLAMALISHSEPAESAPRTPDTALTLAPVAAAPLSTDGFRETLIESQGNSRRGSRRVDPSSTAGDGTGESAGDSNRAQGDDQGTCPGDERSFVRLFADAQVRPTYLDRALLGVQVLDIKGGSFWEALGVRTGDLITEMEYTLIDSPQDGVELIKYVGTAGLIHLGVRDLNGRDRQIQWEAPEIAHPATLPEGCRI